MILQIGLLKIALHRLPEVGQPLEKLKDGRTVGFVDPVYSLDPTESQFSSSIRTYSYSSLRTPPSVIDYGTNSGVSVVKKVETVLIHQSTKLKGNRLLHWMELKSLYRSSTIRNLRSLMGALFLGDCYWSYLLAPSENVDEIAQLLNVFCQSLIKPDGDDCR